MTRLFVLLWGLIFFIIPSVHAYETINLSLDGKIATVQIMDFPTDKIAEKFENEITGLPKSVEVLRFSRDNLGGRTPFAWRIAKHLRERNITTLVEDAYCASMCTLIFMGGTERVATPGASFMIHVVRGDGRNPASTTKVNGYVGSLYKQYGLSKELADQIFITDEQARTDHHYSAREAQQIGLVTRLR